MSFFMKLNFLLKQVICYLKLLFSNTVFPLPAPLHFAKSIPLYDNHSFDSTKTFASSSPSPPSINDITHIIETHDIVKTRTQSQRKRTSFLIKNRLNNFTILFNQIYSQLTRLITD